jgi:hypothetical protein
MFSHQLRSVAYQWQFQNIGKLKKTEGFHIVDSKGSDDGAQHSELLGFVLSPSSVVLNPMH